MWLRRRGALALRSFFTAAAAAAGSTGGGVSVKRVTRSNFLPALDSLRGLVRDADFVAVDLEMTGVTSAPWRDPFEFDRADVRYAKLRDSAEKFAVLQLGVCPCRWDQESSALLAHPHTFFIFHRKELAIDGPLDDFFCQTSSIDFLAKHNFDFNTCISEGISYLSRAQEREAIQKLYARYKDIFIASQKFLDEHVDETNCNNTADLLFIERIQSEFRSWTEIIRNIRTKSNEALAVHKPSDSSLRATCFMMRPAIILDGFSSHQLELVQLVMRKHFSDLIYLHTIGEDGKWQKIVVHVDTVQDRMCLMREIQEALFKFAEVGVQSAAGIRHVIDLLVSEKKLIVGHNCFLDIAHVYGKFSAPLPATMKDFAFVVHENFPYIIDTKHLLTAHPEIQVLMKKRSKSLSSVFSLLCSNLPSTLNLIPGNSVKIRVETDDAISSCFNSGSKHEAGYDALMTGAVFAQLCSHIGIKFGSLLPEANLALHEKVEKYINILYPSWNGGTVLSLSSGEEKVGLGYKNKYPPVSYDRIVLLWRFPSNLKAKDVQDCICQALGPDSVTCVFALDSTAILVQFSREEFLDEFYALKSKLDSAQEDAPINHPLSVLFRGGKTCTATYEAYAEICASSISKYFFADQADAVGIARSTGSCSQKFDSQDLPSSTEYCAEDGLQEVDEQRCIRKTDGQLLDYLLASK